MTEAPFDSDAENSDTEQELPDPVEARTLSIINSAAWQNVKSSTVFPIENNRWDFIIHFTNNTTRRIRIGGDGTIISDSTGPTNTLGERT